MCGLVGMAGTLDGKHTDAFKDLLLFNTPRGKDSTGIFSVDRDQGRKVKDTYLLKAPCHALDLMEYRNFDRVVNGGKYVIIGHGRAATVGKINRQNAHPFDFDKVAGAHNGTIPSFQIDKLKNNEQFGTDSEALYNSINNVGIEETIGSLTGGAWALTWYNKEEGSINLLRNDQRPLYYGVINDGKTLIWSSEFQILHAACDRRNVDTAKMIHELPVDTWLKYMLPDVRDAVLPKPIRTEVKCKEVVATSQASGHFQRNYSSLADGRGTGTVVPLVGARSKYAALAPAKVVNIDRHKRGRVVGSRTEICGWNGRRLDENLFRKITGETCAYSDDIVTWEDVVEGKVDIVFINEGQFCKAEYNQPEMHAWLGGGL